MTSSRSPSNVPACARSSSPAGLNSDPPVTTSCLSVTCHTTGCSPGRLPWSTTPEQAPPGPGCAPQYQRSRCPSWSTSRSGRTGCTASALHRTTATARNDRRHPDRRAAVLPRPAGLSPPSHRTRPPDPCRRRPRCCALAHRPARRPARAAALSLAHRRTEDQCRGLRFLKSSAMASNVDQRTPSCVLMCLMRRSNISSTCGRPETSGWIVIVNTA
jgi:hypothetical protein